MMPRIWRKKNGSVRVFFFDPFFFLDPTFTEFSSFLMVKVICLDYRNFATQSTSSRDFKDKIEILAVILAKKKTNPCVFFFSIRFFFQTQLSLNFQVFKWLK